MRHFKALQFICLLAATFQMLLAETAETIETNEVADLQEAIDPAEVEEVVETAAPTEVEEVVETAAPAEIEEVVETAETIETNEVADLQEAIDPAEIEEVVETEDTSEVVETSEIRATTEAPGISEVAETVSAIENQATQASTGDMLSGQIKDDVALAPNQLVEDSTPGKVLLQSLPDDVIWNSLPQIDKAGYYKEQGRYLLAEGLYIAIIEKTRDERQLKKALLELSEVYFESGKFIKAINMMEKFFSRFPLESSNSERIYRLAEFYQAAGMRQESVALFFKVINSIVMAGAQNLEKHADLSRMAKFEIARNYYMDNSYDKAYNSFNRIDLLELSPANHETVMYYKILASLKAAKPEVGSRLISDFLDRFPDSPYRPELVYLRAEVLMSTGDVEAATDQLLSLLDYVDEVDSPQSELQFWRQQAGNRLANRYYTEGDYLVALRIYQGMVGLNESPEWRMPIIYQMSLSFEKLKMYDRARESYTYLLESLASMPPSKLSSKLKQLQSNANWRLKVMEWKEDTEVKVADLLNEPHGS